MLIAGKSNIIFILVINTLIKKHIIFIKKSGSSYPDS